MRLARLLPSLLGTAALLAATSAGAQAPSPNGMPISLEQPKKVMAGAEAKKNNWPVVIVILDSGGQLVMLQRLDNTQWGSVEIAVVDGKIIGSVGVSGVTPQQDAQIAQTGLDALK